MLRELYIENLAVIKQAAIPFSNHFNVFTGETGAGKSILINGLNAVLGRRASKDIVRAGCEKAVVSALFTELSDDTKAKLEEFGIDFDDDELHISREISADGGSTARINSKTASVGAIREIGATLIDIHGQHDGKILLHPESHIDIIDSFAGLQDSLAEYKGLFKELQDTARRLKKLAGDEHYKKGRLELLKSTAEQIGELGIEDENEDARLEEEYRLAKKSSEIIELLHKSEIALAGDENETGAGEIIGAISDKLAGYEEFSDFNSLSKRLENVGIELADICEELRSLRDKTALDEERYERISNRREQLHNIKRKFGGELKDVISLYEASLSEMNSIATGADEINRLAEIKNELLQRVTEKAEELSKSRKKASEELVLKITEELRFLDMPNVAFNIEHLPGKLTSGGMDLMQLLISVNAGEPPKPIAKIASGGELSRIMLAIKNVIAEKDQIPTLVFDEIDTGVSGRAAQKIGKKLLQASKIRQVLCVTHLSQIAAMADNHLLIEKNTESGTTVTTVRRLSADERKYEIARILSGENITETALKTAEEQLCVVEQL
ncbi:MAG: DNA repair protein RecN [Oscillospiraceae bacterium]|nr:DNA repair protein RecN [Oscillospiraceae bacterium]